ncbi:MAG TPA: caspase family protein [Thermoanaerobaculia bacterium]
MKEMSLARTSIARCVLAASVFSVCAAAAPVPRPVFIYASRSGRPTLDRDAAGGNPFATALVHLLSGGQTHFAQFARDLVTLTRRHSAGLQQPEIVSGEQLREWQVLPRPQHERRVALVVVFSNYPDSALGPSLPGARHDFRRIVDALAKGGFAVTAAHDPDPATLARALEEFRRHSADADVALIYTTGHGIEVAGEARVLLPRPPGGALRVSELAGAARARKVNLVFYAACRSRSR